MEVSGQLHAPAAVAPGERAPGTQWIGGWEGLRARLDLEAKTKISSPCRESNPVRPARSLVAILTGQQPFLQY